MDSEEETNYDDVDSGNESSGDDGFPMDVDSNNAIERQPEIDDYPYEVLSTEEIVKHMIDCIKDVNTVVEVRIKIVRKTPWPQPRLCFSQSSFRFR